MTQAVDSGEWDSGIFASSFCAAAERFLTAFHDFPARLSGVLDGLVKLRDQDRHVSDRGFVFCAVEQNPVSVLVHDPDAPDFDCEAVLASNDVRPIKAVNFRYAKGRQGKQHRNGKRGFGGGLHEKRNLLRLQKPNLVHLPRLLGRRFSNAYVRELPASRLDYRLNQANGNLYRFRRVCAEHCVYGSLPLPICDPVDADRH